MWCEQERDWESKVILVSGVEIQSKGFKLLKLTSLLEKEECLLHTDICTEDILEGSKEKYFTGQCIGRLGVGR